MWLWLTIKGFISGMVGLAITTIGCFFGEFALYGVAAHKSVGVELNAAAYTIFLPPLAAISLGIWLIYRGNKCFKKSRQISRKDFVEAIKHLHSLGYTKEQIIDIATGKTQARA